MKNKHDFKAALDWLKNADFDGHYMTERQQFGTKDFILNYRKTIQFALDFTQRALNGKVSGAMELSAEPHTTMNADDKAIFKAMTAQLAKEVEGEKER